MLRLRTRMYPVRNDRALRSPLHSKGLALALALALAQDGCFLSRSLILQIRHYTHTVQIQILPRIAHCRCMYFHSTDLLFRNGHH